MSLTATSFRLLARRALQFLVGALLAPVADPAASDLAAEGGATRGVTVSSSSTSLTCVLEVVVSASTMILVWWVREQGEVTTTRRYCSSKRSDRRRLGADEFTAGTIKVHIVIKLSPVYILDTLGTP